MGPIGARQHQGPAGGETSQTARRCTAVRKSLRPSQAAVRSQSRTGAQELGKGAGLLDWGRIHLLRSNMVEREPSHTHSDGEETNSLNTL